uniref:Uncharacterized protein n=1 Tax=Rhizophora mucronata TaxID=61149 RepID=A0A2P2PCJ4_RHIMU
MNLQVYVKHGKVVNFSYACNVQFLGIFCFCCKFC